MQGVGVSGAKCVGEGGEGTVASYSLIASYEPLIFFSGQAGRGRERNSEPCMGHYGGDTCCRFYPGLSLIESKLRLFDVQWWTKDLAKMLRNAEFFEDRSHLSI